ncbi:unnamed protein product [Callosobruchus maculatus]|uniref:Uncharacterized protein n=1 Tax=Callosobruchus maculatus TaxID=64391 RepID=A0A653DME7_CALMS|nr:unnamed protein product [Callosobruchus maculatus]
MKIHLLLGVVVLILLQSAYATSDTKAVSTNQLPMTTTRAKLTFVKVVAKKLHDLWENYYGRSDEHTFVGRCIGVARKIRQLLPIMIFLMGVILTKLGFLTLFSLKTMALLGLLLLINASAFAAKVATAFALKGEHKHPQTVHYHVHKDPLGGYYTEHSSPGWDHKSGEASPEIDWDRVESYNLYNKLLRQSQMRSYEEFTR